MTEQELRALVRDAVARHLGHQTPEPRSAEPRVFRPGVFEAGSARADLGPSHAIYLNLVNVGGECVIEPNVTCNHCNYCKSHGH